MPRLQPDSVGLPGTPWGSPWLPDARQGSLGGSQGSPWLPGAPQCSLVLRRAPWSSLRLPSAPWAPHAPQGSVRLPLMLRPQVPAGIALPQPRPASPGNIGANGYYEPPRLRGKGIGTSAETGTGAVLWHISLLFEFSVQRLLRNHVW